MPWITGGAIALGGLIGGSASKSAARTQAAASREATAEERRQYDLSRADLAPYRDTGNLALMELRRQMGFALPEDSMPAMTREQIRARLTPQFTTEAPTSLTSLFGSRGSGEDNNYDTTPAQVVDESGLNAAVEQELARQAAVAGAAGNAPATGAGDPFLTRRFTMADFEADPVRQLGFDFGLSEGTKALRRTFGATGMSRSGAATKALTRFATDYSNAKAGESYGRFTADQSNLFNKLAAVSGIGQAATTTTANLGANSAANIGANIIGAGNARGAAAIAGGNAMTNALSQGANILNQRYTLDTILNRGGIAGGNPVSAPYRVFDEREWM